MQDLSSSAQGKSLAVDQDQDGSNALLALPSENESRVTPSLLSKKTPTAHPQRGRGCQTPALNQGPSPAEGPSEGGHGTSRAPTSAPLGWSSGQPTAIQEPGWCRQAKQGLPELVQNPAGTKQAELGGKWDFCPLPPFFLIYFLNIYINHPLPQLFELCYI